MTVQIGSGSNIDTGKVIGFGSIIIDTPTKYYHPANTVIKGIDNKTDTTKTNTSNSYNSMMYLSMICIVVILIIIFYFLNQSPQKL
jgi:hypothetical protein